MNTTINPGAPSVPQPSVGGAKPAAAGDAGSAAAGPAAADSTAGGERVQLTESARAIGAAARGTDAPVDAQHVERIRQSIADGSYKVDAASVADRLIGLERQIG